MANQPEDGVPIVDSELKPEIRWTDADELKYLRENIRLRSMAEREEFLADSKAIEYLLGDFSMRLRIEPK